MREIAFFDLETTGVSVTEDRIVQISVVITDQNFHVLGKHKKYLNPGIPIQPGATEVHGITNEMVKSCETFKEISQPLFNHLQNKILAGYNIKRFDIPILCEEFERCDLTFIPNGILDSMIIFHEKEKRDLTAALQFYCGKTMENAHDAEADVLATVDITEGQMMKYGLSIEESIALCRKENEIDFAGKIILIDGEPCFSFGKHKDKKVKDHPDFVSWMLRSDFSSNTKNIVKSIIDNTWQR